MGLARSTVSSLLMALTLPSSMTARELKGVTFMTRIIAMYLPLRKMLSLTPSTTSPWVRDVTT